jgi:hypothetical protein
VLDPNLPSTEQYVFGAKDQRAIIIARRGFVEIGATLAGALVVVGHQRQ